MIAIIGVVGVAVGVLSGLLISNQVKPTADQASPWPFIVGLVALCAVGVVAGWRV